MNKTERQIIHWLRFAIDAKREDVRSSLDEASKIGTIDWKKVAAGWGLTTEISATQAVIEGIEKGLHRKFNERRIANHCEGCEYDQICEHPVKCEGRK